MKYKFFLYFYIFIFSIELTYSLCAEEERWGIKVLTDGASDSIYFTPTNKFKSIQSIRKLDYEGIKEI
jgi:hypothetical protein